MKPCFERRCLQITLNLAGTALTVAMLMFGARASHSAAYIDVTRVILSAGSPEANPQITNSGKTPALFQAWIDANSAGSGITVPTDINVPFIIDPPLFRLEPGRSKRLRILADGAATTLHQDRESVFWLNVLEVPPQTQSFSRGSVQFAFHTRIKLFYRPSGINPSAEGSFEQVSFSLAECAGEAPKLIVRNPTAYHQTLLAITITSPAAAEHAQLQTLPIDLRSDGMLTPLSQTEHPMPLGIGAQDPSNARVAYTYINDFGATVDTYKALEIGGSCFDSQSNDTSLGVTRKQAQ